MTTSVVLSIPQIRKVDFHNLFLILILNGILLLQIFNIYLKINIMPSLLINESTTDVASYDIYSQLFYPALNFTIFKHFAFFDMFLLFCLLNEDIFKEKAFWNKMFSYSKYLYLFLFIFIIIQSVTINTIGYEKEISQIIQTVFSDRQTPVTYAVGNFKAAQAWLIEPSYIRCVLFLDLIFIGEIRNGTAKSFDLILIILSAIAILLTTSSTGIGTFGLFVLILLASTFVTKARKKVKTYIYGISIILVILIFIGFPNLIVASLNKISTFISDDGTYGSAVYRMNSIKLSIDVIKFSPLIGLGIGTVYAHSMVFQTIGNIGILGFVVSIVIVLRSVKQKNVYLLSCLFLLVIMMFTGLLEEFTSPYLLFALATLQKETGAQKILCLDTYKRKFS